jgi:pimeloyl-ACP methyl ester carboxylesterase
MPTACPVGQLNDSAFAAATRRVVEAIPQATVVPISAASHALHFDQPEQFADAVRALAGGRLGQAPRAS